MKVHKNGSVTFSKQEFAATQKLAGTFADVLQHLEYIVEILDDAEEDVNNEFPAKDLFNVEKD